VEVPQKAADSRATSFEAARKEAARKEVARPGGKFLVLAGFAATIVVAVIMTRDEAPAAPKAAPVVAQKTAPLPGAPAAAKRAEVTPALTGESGFDSIKIQGIVYHSGHSVVLINGKVLDVGDLINGVKVLSIQPSNVVLTCNGTKKSFLLK